MANIKRIRNYLPYLLKWMIKHPRGKEVLIDFYCDNVTDFICFQNVLKLYPHMRVVAKNKLVQKQLYQYGVMASLYPSYPKIVIMCRHSTWRYPLKKIVKIGMRHGPYHFKDFIKAERYNEFDKFLFTSPTEAEEAKSLGIDTGVGVGFPKLDSAFNNSINNQYIADIRQNINLNSDKKTILFSATWSEKKYSAISKWYDKLSSLTSDYNVLVTVHEWTPSSIKEVIQKTEGIYFIKDYNILPYLLVADLMVGDTSSIIAEFLALRKPVITFKIPVGHRLSSEIVEMLDTITYRITSFSQLNNLIVDIFAGKASINSAKIDYYLDKMFGPLDGKASLRAKEEIDQMLDKLDKV